MGDPTDIVQGAQLIGLGRTRYWKGPRGLQLDVGPFLAALEHATGCTALVFGKPAPSFFAALVEELGEPARFVAMVGDDIVSDVGGAMSAGLMGVLVRTGKFRPRDLDGRIGVVARIVPGPHDAHRQDPHRPMRYDTGRPRAVIRFKISQPRTASLPCPAGLRARRPSPMMDL